MLGVSEMIIVASGSSPGSWIFTKPPAAWPPNQSPAPLCARSPSIGTIPAVKVTCCASSSAGEMLLNDVPAGTFQPLSLTMRLLRACSSKAA